MPTLVSPGPIFTPIGLDDCGAYVLSHTHEGVRVLHDMDTSHINVVHGRLCGAHVVVDAVCDEATWSKWTSPPPEIPPRPRAPSSLHVTTGSVSRRSRRTKEEEPEPVEEVVCEEEDEDEDEETAFDDDEDKDVDTIIE